MRPDQEIIQRWIETGSRVLDLGCGDGALLAWLQREKGVRALGLEIDPANIERCLASGVTVLEQNLDQGLANFESGSFHTVLLAQTLQALANPAKLVDEMLRIGKKGIGTFSNLGNWKSRIDLLLHGRMPVSDFIPHQWPDTHTILFLTVQSFVQLFHASELHVLARTVVNSRHEGSWAMRAWPNFLGEIAIYHITRK